MLITHHTKQVIIKHLPNCHCICFVIFGKRSRLGWCIGRKKMNIIFCHMSMSSHQNALDTGIKFKQVSSKATHRTLEQMRKYINI